MLSALNANTVGSSLVAGICKTAVALIGVEGAGLTVVANDQSGVVCVHGQFSVRVGALTVYRNASRALSLDQASDGYVLAQVAARVMGAAQTKMGTERFIQEMEAGFSRMEPVHQATGMVMGQMGVNAEDALARIRSAAYAADRLIVDFARDLLTGAIVLPNEL